LAFAKIEIVTSEPFLVSFKIAYRIAKCNKPHSIEKNRSVSVTCCY